MATAASAADTGWTGTVSGVWENAANWDAGVPTSTDNAILPDPTATTSTITLPAAAVANQLIVGGSGYTVTAGTLTLSDNLYVDSADASLLISGGATVASPNATVGISGGNSGNTLSVAAGLTVSGTLNVGYDGTDNDLAVVTGGSVSTGALWIGGLATSATNTATVATGSTLTSTSSLVVGYGGDSNEIQVAGSVSSPLTILGNDAGADNNLATVGAGGQWTNPGPLTVGLASDGNSFRVQGGSLTVTGSANDVIVGDGAAASGNSIVVAGGSFSSAATLVIGRAGTGNSFSASAAATVSNDNVRFGLDAGSTGNTGTVDGVGTVWTITNKLRVGSAGDGNALSITNGGVVNVASDVFVGGTSTGSTVSGNSVLVSGSGSKLAILSGVADLVISYGNGTANSVTVADGGTLELASVKIGPFGKLQIGDGAAAGSVTSSATIDAPNGGGSLVFDHTTASLTFANPITGSIRVTQEGTGTTVLSGSSTYSGNTIVTAGTLALSSATNNIASSPTIQVDAGSSLDVSAVSSGFALASAQTLAGEGTVVGGVTANAGSTIAPGGSSVGTLTFGSSLGLFGVLDIDLSGASTDLATVGGTLTLDPASTVSFSVGNPLTEPAYVFADYGSLAGTFGTVSNLPAGYLLDYNYLGSNQLALVTVPEPSALALGAVGGIAAAATARWRRKGNRPS